MKRQKLELSLTQFWSEEFRNELAASVRRPIRQPADTFLSPHADPPIRRPADTFLPPPTPTRRHADPPTRSSLPHADPPTRRHVPLSPRRPADPPTRRHVPPSPHADPPIRRPADTFLLAA